MKGQYGLGLNLKYDGSRQYYISLSAFELDGDLPEEFVNTVRRRDRIEC